MAKAIKSGEVNMTSGPLFSKIIKFFIPVMLSNLLQMLYNAADQAVVGAFAGSDALGSVGSTSSLTNLIVCLVMGLSIGTSTLVARQFGAGNHESVSKAVHTSIFISLICGFAIGIFGFFASRPALLLMGTQEDVLDGAVLYMQITFVGLPVVSLYNFGSAILRAIGDTKRPMYYLTVSGLINVAFNLVFVIFFEMGVAGVAAATIISQTVSAILTMRCLMKSDGCYRFCISKLKYHKTESMQIIKVGVPAALQSSMFSFSNIIIQSGINSISKAAVAGCAAASTIESFVYQAMHALYHTALSFCGQNFGAKKHERILKSLLYCSAIVSVVGIVLGCVAWLFDDFLLGIFINDSPEAIVFGKQRLFMVCVPYFLCGVMDVVCAALRSLNHALPSLINSVVGACVFRVVWMSTVFKHYNSIPSIFVSYPISWVFTLLLHLSMFIYFFNKSKKQEQKFILENKK